MPLSQPEHWPAESALIFLVVPESAVGIGLSSSMLHEVDYSVSTENQGCVGNLVNRSFISRA